jgi:hypothetical protein
MNEAECLDVARNGKLVLFSLVTQGNCKVLYWLP